MAWAQPRSRRTSAWRAVRSSNNRDSSPSTRSQNSRTSSSSNPRRPSRARRNDTDRTRPGVRRAWCPARKVTAHPLRGPGPSPSPRWPSPAAGPPSIRAGSPRRCQPATNAAWRHRQSWPIPSRGRRVRSGPGRPSPSLPVCFRYVPSGPGGPSQCRGAGRARPAARGGPRRCHRGVLGADAPSGPQNALNSTRSRLRLTENRSQLPTVPAADGGLPVVGSAVIGKEILSAIEHERYGVGPERKVSIAIISGGKTATGADRVHRNGPIRYFHHSARQIPGATERN